MNDSLSFEQAYAQLEATVRALQEGGQTLQQMLDLFERGNELARVCAAELDAAELRLTRLRESAPAHYSVIPLDLESREFDG